MPPIASIDRPQETQADATVLVCHAFEHLDNTAPMAQLTTTGSSGLEALPNELLMSIFEELGNGEHRKGWNSNSAVRSGYHALCLVSKRIHLVARPYLYKKVSVSDFRSLVRLCRTIAGDQHLADGISDIRLTLDFHRMTKRGRLPMASKEQAEVCDDCDRIMGEHEISRGARTHGDLIGTICYELLARAVNLCSLAVVIKGRGSFDYLGHGHEDYSTFFDLVRGAVRSDADGAATVFLPLLQNLTLESRRGKFGCEVFEHFLGLPSLTKIRSVRDDGNWYHFAHDRGPSPDSTVARSARRNIASLHLSNPWACQGDLVDVAQSFPCLQVLSVHTRASATSRLRWHMTRGDGGDLSTALGKLTALQKLKIDIYPGGAFSTSVYNYLTGLLGPGKVLSLAQLPFLRQVEVPLFMFAHVGPLGFGGTTAVPHDVLPQALRYLVLLAHQECSEPDGQAGWDSMVAALEFLESLGRDLSSFRQLKKVAYCFRRNSCANPMWVAATERQVNEGPKVSPEGAAEGGPEGPIQVSTRSRIQAIHASFAKQNVEFCVQETISKTKRRTIDFKEWK